MEKAEPGDREVRQEAQHAPSSLYAAGSQSFGFSCPVLGIFPGSPNLSSARNLAGVHTTTFVTAQHLLEHAILSFPSRFTEAVWQGGSRTVVGLYGSDAGTPHLFSLSHLRQQKLFPIRIRSKCYYLGTSGHLLCVWWKIKSSWMFLERRGG